LVTKGTPPEATGSSAGAAPSIGIRSLRRRRAHSSANGCARCVWFVGMLVVGSVACAKGTVQKKGSMPPDALWRGAAAIVGGTIHDLRDPTGPYFTATLRVGVVYQGDVAPDSVSVRIYGPKEKVGRPAIWLLRGGPHGLLTEEYPWTRVGPEQLLIWPADVRDRVLARLEHAYSENAEGMQLVIIRAPSAPGEPLLLWLALLTALGGESSAAIPVASNPILRVERPDGQSTELVLHARPTPSSSSSALAIRLLRTDVPDPNDHVAIPTPLSGTYHVTLTAKTGVPDREPMTASLFVKH
jgi:hypothetical protein